MSSAGETKLVITLAPLSPSFVGDPQEFAEHLVKRLKIFSPFGVETIVRGDSAPLSDEGPWLKNGTQWWVWDSTTSTYVPQDISASENPEIVLATTKPTTFDIPYWAEFTGSGESTRFVGLHLSTGSDYVLLKNVVPSGTTANRPSNPQVLEQYYDTDIQCLIWFERGKWRTVSGVPGDVKHVLGLGLLDVLSKNPGWQEIGSANAGYRGRTIISATKDPGDSPTSVFTPAPGIAAKAAGDILGTETHTLTEAEVPPHTHTVELAPDGTSGSGHRVGVVEHVGGTYDGFPGGTESDGFGGGGSHNNMQPSFNLWCIYKE